jgi:molecular chaperone GrpE
MTKAKKEHDKQHDKQDEQEPSNEEIKQKSEVQELTDTLQRLQAEFENYKKRVDKENAQLIKNANSNLIKELLPVLDSFELAIKNSNGNDNPEIMKFKKGMELIYAQLHTILEDNGLRIIDIKDKRFDPYKHEVLMVKELTDKEDDIILQEFQKGYMLNDIVLRHSKVMISRKPGVNDGQQKQQ